LEKNAGKTISENAGTDRKQIKTGKIPFRKKLLFILFLIFNKKLYFNNLSIL